MKKNAYKKIELTPIKEGYDEDEVQYQPGQQTNTLINTTSPPFEYFDSSDSDSLDGNLESYISNGNLVSNFSINTGSRRNNKRRKRRQ